MQGITCLNESLPLAIVFFGLASNTDQLLMLAFIHPSLLSWFGGRCRPVVQ